MTKKILIAGGALLLVGAVALMMKSPKAKEWESIKAEAGRFVVTVPASGTVEPENKISITSPIAGRVDKILVEEGRKVRRGQVLAWMSSTDRAALLDSAAAQGEESLKEWADVYKATPILSPASGVIIAKNIVPGQTVSQQNVLFELSDRLVIIADVDETDLGKVWLDQAATVTVDSFPGIVVNTRVKRIAHQSKLKNSINTYEVLLLPEELPKEFRAGLTASVQFVFQEKENAVLLPTWVGDGRDNLEKEFRVPGEGASRKLKLGLSNGQKIEVLEGLGAGESVLVEKQKLLGEKPAAVFGIGGRRR